LWRGQDGEESSMEWGGTRMGKRFEYPGKVLGRAPRAEK